MKTKNLSMTIILFLLFSGTLVLAYNTPPSNDEIQSRWKQHSKEEMTIDGSPVQIALRGKEIAFLMPVYFVARGRNDMNHAVLVRPAIKAIREVAYPVSRDSVAHDLDHDGISEIETVSLGSGQGTTDGEKSIVQFDGWKPIILHRKNFYDNLGACGSPEAGLGKCESQEINWQFTDLNHDGKDDLIEEIIIKTGTDSDKLKIKKKIIKKYLFNNGKFIRSDGRQINVAILRQRLKATGVSPDGYSIQGDPFPAEDGGVLDRVSGYWRIREYDRGKFINELLFASETEACAYFFDRTMSLYVPQDNRHFFKQRYRLDW